MTIYAVLPAYDKNDKVYYQVLPYNLKGTIKCHFEFELQSPQGARNA